MMGYGAGLGFGLGGWLVALGCIALVAGTVLLIAWALGRTSLGSAQPNLPPRTDANDVLRLRFARGEITAEEFAAARQVLESGQ